MDQRYGRADMAYFVLLLLVAGFAVLIGIANAIQFHSATDFFVGLVSFVPMTFLAVLEDRRPRSGIAKWLPRVTALLLTIGIPLAIWTAMHGPPCPPNCAAPIPTPSPEV